MSGMSACSDFQISVATYVSVTFAGRRTPSAGPARCSNSSSCISLRPAPAHGPTARDAWRSVKERSDGPPRYGRRDKPRDFVYKIPDRAGPIKGGTVNGPRWIVLVAGLGLVGALAPTTAGASPPQQQTAARRVGVPTDTVPAPVPA